MTLAEAQLEIRRLAGELHESKLVIGALERRMWAAVREARELQEALNDAEELIERLPTHTHI